MNTNEAIYSLIALISFAYGAYKWAFACKKSTDYDDYKLIRAYTVAKQKGLIK